MTRGHSSYLLLVSENGICQGQILSRLLKLVCGSLSLRGGSVDRLMIMWWLRLHRSLLKVMLPDTTVCARWQQKLLVWQCIRDRWSGFLSPKVGLILTWSLPFSLMTILRSTRDESIHLHRRHLLLKATMVFVSFKIVKHLSFILFSYSYGLRLLLWKFSFAPRCSRFLAAVNA